MRLRLSGDMPEEHEVHFVSATTFFGGGIYPFPGCYGGPWVGFFIPNPHNILLGTIIRE